VADSQESAQTGHGEDLPTSDCAESCSAKGRRLLAAHSHLNDENSREKLQNVDEDSSATLHYEVS
jgi:hypothetical protein